MKKSPILFAAFIAMFAGASAAPKGAENTQSNRLDAIEKRLDALEEKEDSLSPYKMERQNATVDFETSDRADPATIAKKRQERTEKNRQYDDRFGNNEDVAGVADMFSDADKKYKEKENDRLSEAKRKQIEQLKKELDELNKKIKKTKGPKNAKKERNQTPPEATPAAAQERASVLAP